MDRRNALKIVAGMLSAPLALTRPRTECDLVGGWVVLLDHDANGKRVIPIRARVRSGELLIRRL